MTFPDQSPAQKLRLGCPVLSLGQQTRSGAIRGSVSGSGCVGPLPAEASHSYSASRLTILSQTALTIAALCIPVRRALRVPSSPPAADLQWP